MRTLLFEHMSDHAPKLKARLWRAKGRNAFLDADVDAVLEVLKWNLEGLNRTDPAGEAMAHEIAIAELFKAPGCCNSRGSTHQEGSSNDGFGRC